MNEALCSVTLCVFSSYPQDHQMAAVSLFERREHHGSGRSAQDYLSGAGILT
jgi:hypothetical protein